MFKFWMTKKGKKEEKGCVFYISWGTKLQIKIVPYCLDTMG